MARQRRARAENRQKARPETHASRLTGPAEDADSGAAAFTAAPGPGYARKEIWLLAGLTALALALRLARVDSRSLWVDELSTRGDALHILRWGFWERTHFLYFLITRLFLAADASPFMLRLPSVLFSAAAAPAIYAATRRWTGDRQAALTAALLAAISLCQVYFGQEARYYGAMTFLAALSLVWLGRLIDRPRWIDLILFLLINAIGFGVHPTTAIFFAAQGSYLLAALVPRLVQRTPGGEQKRGRAARFRHAVFAALILALMAAVYQLFLARHVGIVIDRLRLFPNIPLTENVSFSWRFFLAPIHGFTLAPGRKMGWSPAAGWILSALFLCGVFGGLRRCRAFTVLTLWAYLTTYASLFLYKAGIPFGFKYIIYLYPLFAAFVALGLVQFCRAAARLLPDTAARRIGLWPAIAALVALHAAQAIDYAYYYRYDKYPLIDTMKTVRAHQPEGGILASNAIGHGLLKEYAEPYGFNDARFHQAEADSPALCELVRTGETVFFCPFYYSSSGRPTDGPAASLFEKAGEAISSVSDSLNIPVYRLDGARLFIPGQTKKLTPSTAADGGFSEDSALFELRSIGDARVYAAVPSHWLDDPSFSLTIETPEAPPARLDFSLDHEGFPRSASFLVPEGDFKLTLTFGADRPEGDLRLITESGRIPGWLCAQPSDWWKMKAGSWEDEEDVLVFMENGFVSYPIEPAVPGPHQFHLDALHDMPGVVDVAVALNGRPLGVLSFDRANNEYGELPFTADLDAGVNDLRLTFLNDVPHDPQQSGPSDENTDLAVRGLRFDPLSGPGESAFLADDAFFPIQADNSPVAFAQARLDGRLGGWQWFGPGQVETVGADTIRLAIPPDSDMNFLASAPFPVQSGKRLYCSMLSKVEGLRNHTANIQYLFFDEAGKSVGAQWVFNPGYREDQGWQPLTACRITPEGAAFASVSLAVYGNESRPGEETEVVWFRDFRFWTRYP